MEQATQMLYCDGHAAVLVQRQLRSACRGTAEASPGLRCSSWQIQASGVQNRLLPTCDLDNHRFVQHRQHADQVPVGHLPGRVDAVCAGSGAAGAPSAAPRELISRHRCPISADCTCCKRAGLCQSKALPASAGWLKRSAAAPTEAAHGLTGAQRAGVEQRHISMARISPHLRRKPSPPRAVRGIGKVAQQVDAAALCGGRDGSDAAGTAGTAASAGSGAAPTHIAHKVAQVALARPHAAGRPQKQQAGYFRARAAAPRIQSSDWVWQA